MEVEETSSKTLSEKSLEIYPNPSRGGVAVSYVLKQGAAVQCRIYDAAGRVVRDLVSAIQPAGKQSVTWDRLDHSGRPVTAGVYVLRVQAGTSATQAKLVIVD